MGDVYACVCACFWNWNWNWFVGLLPLCLMTIIHGALMMLAPWATFRPTDHYNYADGSGAEVTACFRPEKIE